MMKEEKGEEKKAVKTVELSTTARNRAKARGKKHTQEEGDVDMDDGSTKKDTSADEKATSKAEEPTAEGKDDKSEKEKAKKEPAEPGRLACVRLVPGSFFNPCHSHAEPSFSILQNPCRVTFPQQRYIQLHFSSQRFRPVRKVMSSLNFCMQTLSG